ncbi:hypothetical protein BDV18DRAFT_139262 [Aspergillus unguis]
MPLLAVLHLGVIHPPLLVTPVHLYTSLMLVMPTICTTCFPTRAFPFCLSHFNSVKISYYSLSFLPSVQGQLSGCLARLSYPSLFLPRTQPGRFEWEFES